MAVKQLSLFAILCVCIAAIGSCERDFMSENGFRLPDGDPIRGKEVFVYLQCNQCHTVSGLELPVIELADSPHVELGGRVTKVKTFGELVTAIINPSHRLADGYPIEEISESGESKMPGYNNYMTVQELVDIVIFLQPHYELFVPLYF